MSILLACQEKLESLRTCTSNDAVMFERERNMVCQLEMLRGWTRRWLYGLDAELNGTSNYCLTY